MGLVYQEPQYQDGSENCLTRLERTFKYESMKQNQIIVLEMPWNRLHREIQSLEVDAKNKAAQIGEMLITKKAEMKHGEFIPWIEANCEFSYDSAKDYMKVAKAKRERAPDFNACTSIREVLEIAKKPKERKPTAEKKPKLDKDDRRKINKLRKLVETPTTPTAMKDAAEAKLKGYEEAHGKHYKDYIEDVKQQKENQDKPYIDSEYVAQQMAKVVLDEQYNYQWRLAQIQDWIEQAFEDDERLMQEFNFIMENKGESHD